MAARETGTPASAWRQGEPAEAGLPYTDPFSIFELIHPLGRGSYGAVHKARILSSGDIVAVKIIPVAEQEEIAAIQKEIAMLRECNHPNIVKYYGSWRTRDALWICMEYCAGGSVSDIMHTCGSGLDEDMISYICAQTLAGLSYLHSLGKVHRDIKCGNILLTEAGEVKLADFGVAAQLTATMSKRNTFIGTPHWMAPEVIQVSHYDGKVDIWALGVSAIEMAEMFPPRWKINPNRVLFMVVKDPPPRLADKERWSLSFQDFVAQCLQKDPRARPTARLLQQHKFAAREAAATAASVDSSSGRGATVVSPAGGPPSARAAGRRSVGFGDVGGTLVAQPAASPGGARLGEAGEASQDYMAAVQAMDEDPAAALLDVAGLPTPGGRLLAQQRAPKTEAQRWVEKLHTLYSSGAVVPLPFLRAVDAAPLALLGADRGPPGVPAAGAQGQELSWQEALAQVAAESVGGEEALSGTAPADLLPEAVLQQVARSPVLLNLATSLAHHKRLLAAAAAAQAAAAGDGLPARLREALRARADDLSTTLRTILCL
ncbi:hypothetical protein COHA_009303 [Chlorella ohadii]|uniref:non-specific serine/threonine protein kinase n=1 Tax=Chlorella ohadii TaxID=2649997 RepID=A0AAD5DJS6_9CHLO|nr:hypothetical protein COHA_009303 [Chlorella ohadii]